MTMVAGTGTAMAAALSAAALAAPGSVVMVLTGLRFRRGTRARLETWHYGLGYLLAEQALDVTQQAAFTRSHQ